MHDGRWRWGDGRRLVLEGGMRCRETRDTLDAISTFRQDELKDRAVGRSSVWQGPIDAFYSGNREEPMGQKIVSIHGSPRKNGNSALLAAEIQAGASDAGAQVVSFHLQGMDIRPCTACDACRGSVEAECVIEDDMGVVYRALREADGLIIATPIYWFAASGQTKVFLDRCYALGGPDGTALRGLRVAIAVTYEDPDPFRSGAVNALRSFQDMFAYVGAPIVAMVYGSAAGAGEIASNSALLVEARAAGRRLVCGASSP